MITINRMPMKTTEPRTYSLPTDVCEFLDKLPRNARSKFVSQTLRREVGRRAKEKALATLDSIVPVKTDGKKSSVELVQELRNKRRQQIIDNATNNGE